MANCRPPSEHQAACTTRNGRAPRYPRLPRCRRPEQAARALVRPDIMMSSVTPRARWSTRALPSARAHVRPVSSAWPPCAEGAARELDCCCHLPLASSSPWTSRHLATLLNCDAGQWVPPQGSGLISGDVPATMAAKLAFVAVLALALVRRSGASSTRSLTMSMGAGCAGRAGCPHGPAGAGHRAPGRGGADLR
jgi:hypothetical protein